MRNKLYTKQEIEEVRSEWEERMNEMDSASLQVFANNLARALSIAKIAGCNISSNPCSMQYTPVYEIVNVARGMAEKKGYK